MVSVNDVQAAGQAEVAPEREAGVRLAAVNGHMELQQVLLNNSLQIQNLNLQELQVL